MGRLNEKQQLIAILAGAVVLSLIFAVLIYLDHQAVNAHSDTNDEAAMAAPQEEWGERRKIEEFNKQLKAATDEAAKIKEREDQVIVYREVVERDAAVLPDSGEVNQLASTIREFENMSSVALTQLGNLDVKPGQGIQVVPFDLQLSGTFDNFLKFLNLFESYDRIINTRSFTLSQGTPFGDWPEIYAEHKIALSMETYVYTRQAESDQVPIPSYEQRKNSPEIQKQIRQLKAAKIDNFQLRPRVNRRDPLISPRRAPPEDLTTEDQPDLQEQKTAVASLAKRVRALDGRMKAHEQMMADKNYVQAVQAKETINEELPKLEQEIANKDPDITDVALRERWNVEVIQEFQRVRAVWLEGDAGGPIKQVVTARIAQDFLDKMRDEWNADEYENVLRVYQAYQGQAAGKEVQAEAQRLVDEMDLLTQQAQNQLDFRKLGLTSTGIIHHSDPSRSRAIIDKRPRKIGDYVDEERRCRLVEITPEGLLFDFRGERIWLKR